ncbi:uncharacterized protein G2W53_036136 [Senna tora]|uniref:Uncharacterized protein n=1 Tax=Senna tora TaxID=362788 RepID=A0A834SS15_9FABA|nr:uncharacterized protein G2W53_036136 [Senna tora]
MELSGGDSEITEKSLLAVGDKTPLSYL